MTIAEPYILVIFFTCIPLAAILYAFSNFYQTTMINSKISTMIIVSILFAALQLTIKIPIFHLSKDVFEPAMIHTIWIAMTFISVLLFQRFYLKKHTSIYSVIIAFLMIMLFLCDYYLNKFYGYYIS